MQLATQIKPSNIGCDVPESEWRGAAATNPGPTEVSVQQLSKLWILDEFLKRKEIDFSLTGTIEMVQCSMFNEENGQQVGVRLSQWIICSSNKCRSCSSFGGALVCSGALVMLTGFLSEHTVGRCNRSRAVPKEGPREGEGQHVCGRTCRNYVLLR